jgi:hypothetical protein
MAQKADSAIRYDEPGNVIVIETVTKLFLSFIWHL